MTTNKQLTPDEIKASDPFRSGDVQLQWVDFNAPIEDSSWTDPRFSKPDTDPTKSLAELMAQEFSKSGDSEVARLMPIERDNGVFYCDGEAIRWSQRGGMFYAVALDRTTDPPRKMRFQSDSYDGLCSLVSRSAGRLYRDLSPGDELRSARLASAGDISGAIVAYVTAALRGSSLTPAQIINDPHFVPLTDAAAFFVFRHSPEGADYADSQKQREFLEQFVAGRPVTVALLSQAWSRYKRDEMLGHISPQNGPQNEAPSRADLENLSDEEFESLRLAVMKERAASGRR